MENGANETTYVATPVTGGCVSCRLKGQQVPATECMHCTKGFIVQLGGDASYALCPATGHAATVGEIMTSKITAVHPGLPIESLILLLVDEGVQAVPVVDENQVLIGMVSKSDLIFDDYEWAELRDETFWLRRVAKLPRGLQTEGDLFLEELLHSTTVRDIMSGDPITVTPGTPVVAAARLMGERHVHGCPVVDAAGALKGMVTSLDVARWVGSRAEP